MRFDLSDDQRAVRDAINDLCATRWSSAAARRYGAGEEDGGLLWRELAGAGWTGMTVPAERGGLGLGAVELALACEAAGRSLAPGTFFGNAAAAILVDVAGDGRQRDRWLPGFAGGAARGALGVLQPDGTALVYDGEGAAAIIVTGPRLAGIADAAGSTFTRVPGVDVTRRLTRVRLGDVDEMDGDIDAAIDRIEVALAAELVGVAQRSMDLAVEHARTRQQFGRPIGAYQAVSHRCADMLLDVESARSAVLFAAWSADNDAAALPFGASVAKVAAAEGARRVTASSIQVHGGIGFTWEHDCHLLLRRATASAHLLGGADWHLDRIARLRGLTERELLARAGFSRAGRAPQPSTAPR